MFLFVLVLSLLHSQEGGAAGIWLITLILQFFRLYNFCFVFCFFWKLLSLCGASSLLSCSAVMLV